MCRAALKNAPIYAGAVTTMALPWLPGGPAASSEVSQSFYLQHGGLLQGREIGLGARGGGCYFAFFIIIKMVVPANIACDLAI